MNGTDRGVDEEAAPLSADQRADLERHLLDELQHVGVQIAGFRATLDGLLAAADLEPPDDEHDPDGTTAYERAQVASLLTEAEARLESIGQMVRALDEPGFGRCKGCGEPVPFERLRSVPGTTRCVRCATTGR